METSLVFIIIGWLLFIFVGKLIVKKKKYAPNKNFLGSFIGGVEGVVGYTIVNSILNRNAVIVRYDWLYYLIFIAVAYLLYTVNNFLITSVFEKGKNIVCFFENNSPLWKYIHRDEQRHSQVDNHASNN